MSSVILFSSLSFSPHCFIFVWGWNCALLGVPHGLHELSPQTLPPTSAVIATAPAVRVERKGKCMLLSIEVLGLDYCKASNDRVNL